MFQDQGSMNAANWQIANGMTVFATDGTKLGTVRNYNPQAGYLDVHKGWLFGKDFFVPLSAVDTVAEDGVTLRLSKGELSGDRYNAPPVSASGANEQSGKSGSDISWAGEEQPPTRDDSDRFKQTSTGRTGADRPVDR